jgi:hypothetical protein
VKTKYQKDGKKEKGILHFGLAFSKSLPIKVLRQQRKLFK